MSFEQALITGHIVSVVYLEENPLIADKVIVVLLHVQRSEGHSSGSLQQIRVHLLGAFVPP